MIRYCELETIAAACLVACALLTAGACEDVIATDTFEVEIGGETFRLEVAADRVTRYAGLGGRESIEANGGMIFVFPETAIRYFVMRDCIIPIDIMFLDGAGTVTATYTMQPERPRAEGESNTEYERRLKRYYSKSDSRYVIELHAGTINRLGIEHADRVTLNTQGLERTFEQTDPESTH